jgi:putative DNA primase/helicase
MAATLEAALAYVKAGLSVLPVRADGSKTPAISRWKEYQQRLPTEPELEGWFGKKHLGIGVICGKISSGLELIDFDAEAETIYPAWVELVEAEVTGLVNRLCVVKTPKGYHVRYRCATPIPGNTKLAMTAGKPVEVLIETRGEGGYGIAPGSPIECHDSRIPYEHRSGPKLSQVETITPDEREILIRCARSFDRSVEAEPRHVNGDQAQGVSPGDDYSTRGPDWSEILGPHGWACARELGHARYWRRPGKVGAGWSATTGVCTNCKAHDLLCVFSTNAPPFPGPANGRACSSHTKFSAFALLNHAGDFRAAAKALAADGYGDRRPSGGRPEAQSAAVDGSSIILDYLRTKYEPTFRRDSMIYSAKRGREIRKAEVCGAPGSDLIDTLLTASDFPRYENGSPKRSAVPTYYRNWAPIAWQDLLDSLPDEQDAPEIAGSAREQFRETVANALLTMQHFQVQHRGPDRTDHAEVQRRSLIAWCVLWAKPGKWASVRTLRLWCRRDAHGDLHVAMHQSLFGQINRTAPWSHRRFVQLCELYEIGTSAPERPGGWRAVELTSEFIADLLAGPIDETVDGTCCSAAMKSGPPTVPSTVPSTEPHKGHIEEQ